MSDPLVRACLANQKSQTRRLSKGWRVGDQLYVREAWACDDRTDAPRVRYRADGVAWPWPRRIEAEWARVFSKHGTKWRPPRFMFRALARIWLEVTAVRDEPLQSISLEDILAEGVLPAGMELPANEEAALATARAVFARTWDSLHPDVPWGSNPEVSVVTFRVMKIEDLCLLCGEQWAGSLEPPHCWRCSA